MKPEPKGIRLPAEFESYLEEHPEFRTRFEKFPVSHQREWIKYISDAKRPATRQLRLQKVIRDVMEKSRD